MPHDTITIVHSPAIQLQWHTALRWCWLDIWNGVTLALDGQFVRWYWCMFEFECVLLGIRCTITIAYSPAIQLQWRWYTIYDGSAPMLMLVEYMERYCVGFGQTGCTLVLVHVWIWMCYYLVYDTLWNHHNCILACYILKYNTNRNDLWLCADVDCIYGTVSWWFWMNSAYVGIWACLNLNESLFGVWCTMTWSQLHTRLSFKYTTMTMIYGCALILVEYMQRSRDATVPWWLWANRRYVGKHWCMFEFECVITDLAYDALWNNHNCALACYSNTLQWQWLPALRCCWLYMYMGRYRVGFGRTESTLGVLVHVWIRICHCLVYDTIYKTSWQLYTRLLFNYNGNDMHTALGWC